MTTYFDGQISQTNLQQPDKITIRGPCGDCGDCDGFLAFLSELELQVRATPLRRMNLINSVVVKNIQLEIFF